jgi:hypothetical protein
MDLNEVLVERIVFRIPSQTKDVMRQRHLFDHERDFDNWMTAAVLEKMEKERILEAAP